MMARKQIRWLTLLGFTGIAVFTACMIGLHMFQPELSPMDEAMSYYVHGRHGWLTSVGLAALGIGSLAIMLSVAQMAHGPGSRLGMAFLFLWSLGAILGGIFSADPRGNWDQPPSMSGAIHGVAALIALSSFPVACAALTRNLRRDNRWHWHSSLLGNLAILVIASFIVFMASLTPVFIRPGPPILLGLTERVLFVSFVAWLTVVALGLFRISRVPNERRRRPNRHDVTGTLHEHRPIRPA